MESKGGFPENTEYAFIPEQVIIAKQVNQEFGFFCNAGNVVLHQIKFFPFQLP